jgi:hypothetical protein
VRNGDIHLQSFIVLQGFSLQNNVAVAWVELQPEAMGGVQFASRCRITQEFQRGADADAMVNGAMFTIRGSVSGGSNIYRVIIKGDFIRDQNGRGLDGDHLPPWVPGRRSGDGVEGGTFESWFVLSAGDGEPPDVNRIDEPELIIRGIPLTVARAIVESRAEEGAFSTVSNLRGRVRRRLGLTTAEFDALWEPVRNLITVRRG